jgi:hypothetical protein
MHRYPSGNGPWNTAAIVTPQRAAVKRESILDKQGKMRSLLGKVSTFALISNIRSVNWIVEAIVHRIAFLIVRDN